MWCVFPLNCPPHPITPHPDPTQITYVKTSQGFDWNQDIFLPSSSDITIHNGINRPEAVHEIVLTDEDRFLPS